MGNATSPTVMPAIRSEIKSRRRYPGSTVHSFGIQGDQDARKREMKGADNYLDYSREAEVPAPPCLAGQRASAVCDPPFTSRVE
jgi:hypothetical protein